MFLSYRRSNKETKSFSQPVSLPAAQPQWNPCSFLCTCMWRFFFHFLRIWLELKLQVGFFTSKCPCRTIRPTNRSHQVHDMIYAKVNLEQLKVNNYFHFHFAWKQKRTKTTLKWMYINFVNSKSDQHSVVLVFM